MSSIRSAGFENARDTINDGSSIRKVYGKQFCRGKIGKKSAKGDI
jgi:hypothetical protein